ncbi:MAG: nicotinate-nucleotide--dimethylbenzimidazole phosphoribosyltransferase [Roseiarcus sp.]
MSDRLKSVSQTLIVDPLDRRLETSLRDIVEGKAKPPGSLGRIEDLAVRLGLIQGRLDPRLRRVVLFVFAGDHGLTEEGVSSYPAGVTAAMVTTFLAQKACVNAFARAVDIDVCVVDAGVATELPPHPRLIDAKVRKGTRNAAREPALTLQETEQALARGRDLVGKAIDEGADAIAIGEMGIGNTASSALLMHRLAPAPLESCVGRGAGHNAVGLERKIAVLRRAAGRSSTSDPLEALCEFGGCEIAMMAGAMFGTAARQRPVVVDGFISTAAALVAIRMQPALIDYCIFSHRSAEQGHGTLLKALGVEPLFDLGMRLGEGSGAALAIPFMRAAAGLITDVANLSDVLAGTM